MKILALVSSGRKTGEHGPHRADVQAQLIFKIQQKVWKQEMPGSVDYAYWQGQG
jgi:hypothetical protein